MMNQFLSCTEVEGLLLNLEISIFRQDIRDNQDK